MESGQVKHVFLDYPIEKLHPHAFRAHEAARCAGEQDRHWDMHELLFANQSAQAPDALVGRAETLGLDMPAFRECFDSETYAAAIRERIAEAQRLRVTATPTFLPGVTDPESETLSATKSPGRGQTGQRVRDGDHGPARGSEIAGITPGLTPTRLSKGATR